MITREVYKVNLHTDDRYLIAKDELVEHIRSCTEWLEASS
jgi:hypothetical protein